MNTGSICARYFLGTANACLVCCRTSSRYVWLKAQPGKDMSVGGAGLAASFMRLGLIDEYRLYLRPIFLGNGKRMFGLLQDKLKVRLVENHLFGSGVVLLRYQRADMPG